MQQMTTIGDAAGPSLLATVEERCPNCAASMAADQRYCTECGERRGQPRLPFMDGRTRPATAAAAAATAPRVRRVRPSSSTALIAGICTLLLAMGVGVLIGESGSDPAAATSAPAVQVVSVPGAAAAPAGAAAAATAPAGAAKAATGDAASKTSGATSTKKASGSAKPAATKKGKTAPVVKLGDKGTGKGYKNGKFTGDFFGG